MTEAEKIFWENVRNRRFRNLKFRRQQIIDGFVIDFYCDELRLCVEVDGDVHDSPQAANYDVERDEVLKNHRLRVIRISNEDVINNISGILEKM